MKKHFTSSYFLGVLVPLRNKPDLPNSYATSAEQGRQPPQPPQKVVVIAREQQQSREAARDKKTVYSQALGDL